MIIVRRPLEYLFFPTVKVSGLIEKGVAKIRGIYRKLKMLIIEFYYLAASYLGLGFLDLTLLRLGFSGFEETGGGSK